MRIRGANLDRVLKHFFHHQISPIVGAPPPVVMKASKYCASERTKNNCGIGYSSIRHHHPSTIVFLVLLLWSTVLLQSLSHAAPEEVSVNVYEGPSSNGGKCPSEEETIRPGNYVRIHFSVSIAETSKTGEPGRQYESTLTEGEPVGVTIGVNEVIPGWEKGLPGLCQGDKATLIVPPDLAYGEEGTALADGEDIPGGATIQFDIQVISILEGPPEDEDEIQAKAMFAKADTDNDGKLSRTEFDTMFLQQLGALGEDTDNIKEQLDHFWNSQDYNGDGFLSIEEFLGPSEADDGEDTDPEQEFAALDTDGDGKLSPAEIEAFFTTLGQDVPEDFWDHLDEDKDGFITYQEFFVDEDEEDFDDLEQEL